MAMEGDIPMEIQKSKEDEDNSHILLYLSILGIIFLLVFYLVYKYRQFSKLNELTDISEILEELENLFISIDREKLEDNTQNCIFELSNAIDKNLVTLEQLYNSYQHKQSETIKANIMELNHKMNKTVNLLRTALNVITDNPVKNDMTEESKIYDFVSTGWLVIERYNIFTSKLASSGIE